jgi:hypothetical protein
LEVSSVPARSQRRMEAISSLDLGKLLTEKQDFWILIT